MFLSKSPIKAMAKKAKLILAAGLVLAIVSLLISLVLPAEYRADAQVLIISKSRYGVDPYTVVKSAERVGENIAQVMSTDDFFEKVMSQPGYVIDKSKFEDISERKKRKAWQKTISTSVVYGTGVLNVSTYSTSKNQARQLAGAAVDTLAAKGWEYVGGDVTIKVVNNPVVTNWPVRPNALVNTVLGFIIGVVLMGFSVARKYNIA